MEIHKPHIAQPKKRFLTRLLNPFIFLLVLGCFDFNKGIEIVNPDEVVIYGPNHYQNTRYLGTDHEYHYLRWRVGKRYGDWKIEKSKLNIESTSPYNEENIGLMLNELRWQEWLSYSP